MRLNLSVMLLLAALGGQLGAQQSEFSTGRSYYAAGEFKKASQHFQVALKLDPNDAESHYWLGMSYQVLASIAAPFDGRYNSKARASLTRAVELAPTRQDYRRELFEFLLEAADSSRSALQQAVAVLRMSEGDPEYRYMRQRLERERQESSSSRARMGRLLNAGPQAILEVSALPAALLSKRSGTVSTQALGDDRD